MVASVVVRVVARQPTTWRARGRGCVRGRGGLVAGGRPAGRCDRSAPGALGSETRASCRDLVVLVNQATEAIPAPNAGGSRHHIRPSPDLDSPGRPEREASVRPLIVVVPHVLVENALKMTPTPEQRPVQTLLPDRPHPALRDRVGVRRLDRGLDNLDAVADEDIIEGPSELAVPVANKEPPRAG